MPEGYGHLCLRDMVTYVRGIWSPMSEGYGHLCLRDMVTYV